MVTESGVVGDRVELQIDSVEYRALITTIPPELICWPTFTFRMLFRTLVLGGREQQAAAACRGGCFRWRDRTCCVQEDAVALNESNCLPACHAVIEHQEALAVPRARLFMTVTPLGVPAKMPSASSLVTLSRTTWPRSANLRRRGSLAVPRAMLFGEEGLRDSKRAMPKAPSLKAATRDSHAVGPNPKTPKAASQ